MSLPDTETRAHCFRCDKPATMCLCPTVQALDNRVRIHVLQHRREHRHPLGTVRLLKIGLQALDVHVLPSRGRSAAAAPIAFPPGTAILYPSPDAVDLDDLPDGMQLEHLVVIDGTWSHVHRIHRDSPWLSDLVHVRLTPTEGSRYRIRTEPRQECLSTVEAVVAALRVVEPDLEGTDGLLGAFETMIDDQIRRAQGRLAMPRRKKRAPRRSRAFPDALRRDPGDIVLVYAEAAPDASSADEDFSAARVSAISLDGSRRFDRMVRVRTPLDDHLWNQFGLDPAKADTPASSRDVLDAFSETFRGEAGSVPVLVAWGSWTHRFLRHAVPAADHQLLKGLWGSVADGRVPGLGRVVESLGLVCEAPPFAGRAGVRLAEARALTQHLVAGGET